jgi:hypothetical protein
MKVLLMLDGDKLTALDLYFNEVSQGSTIIGT